MKPKPLVYDSTRSINTAFDRQSHIPTHSMEGCSTPRRMCTSCHLPKRLEGSTRKNNIFICKECKTSKEQENAKNTSDT